MPDSTAVAPRTEPPRPTLVTYAEAATRKARGEKLPTCEHGLDLVARTDGKPCCQFCRRRIPAVAPEPPPAPADELAAVRQRRTSRTPASGPLDPPDNVIQFRPRTRGA